MLSFGWCKACVASDHLHMKARSACIGRLSWVHAWERSERARCNMACSTVIGWNRACGPSTLRILAPGERVTVSLTSSLWAGGTYGAREYTIPCTTKQPCG